MSLSSWRKKQGSLEASDRTVINRCSQKLQGAAHDSPRRLDDPSVPQDDW